MTVNQAQSWIDKLSTMRDAGILKAGDVKEVINRRAVELAMFGAEPKVIEFYKPKKLNG